ncbi:MAG: RNA polymerase sigma-70 factor [Cyclobacteriaceae bacterium]|nr:RNA polymerase sigma-70 factor [Cyclobacteriaceae bacterium HetDA_MAG_MS6]
MIKKSNSKVRQIREVDYRKAAFENVYKVYFERLYAYALVITGSESTAKDVVSEVFFNLWSSDRELSTIKDIKAYLFTSVKNQALRSMSLDPIAFESFQGSLEIESVEHINPEDLMIGQELEDFVNEIIGSLPPQCQLVFKMVKQENLKYAEVAEQLGISPNTVKNHLISAMKSLRAALELHFNEVPILKLLSSLGCLVLALSGILLLFQ